MVSYHLSHVQNKSQEAGIVCVICRQQPDSDIGDLQTEAPSYVSLTWSHCGQNAENIKAPTTVKQLRQ